ncbi:hypothetical protein PsYK624_067430 [Phanerochaete sordida]|uniref:Uncharacterized protein n=1 Tax=Phanerochaete sordida TaxID=48140 RepID=A0A9P3GA53_9APHY|nr:hypothetical protein PsYK624_067430 [Phanerochaete sordida]
MEQVRGGSRCGGIDLRPHHFILRSLTGSFDSGAWPARDATKDQAPSDDGGWAFEPHLQPRVRLGHGSVPACMFPLRAATTPRSQ